jgi:hypothetical protein
VKVSVLDERIGDDVLIEKQISRSTKEFYFKRRKMTTSSSWFRHVADTQTTWLSDRPFGELRRLMYGFNHAALVSLACAGNVKSSAMINGGSDNRKAKRYIDTALEAEDFDGTVALVMVHGDNHIEVAPLSQVKKCVSG